MQPLTNYNLAVKATQEERLFQRQVLELAVVLGWKRELCYHTFEAHHGQSGFPDILLMKPPRLLVVKLRRETLPLTHAQEVWLQGFQACGIEAYVLRPSNWNELAAVLNSPSAPQPTCRPSDAESDADFQERVAHWERVLRGDTATMEGGRE